MKLVRRRVFIITNVTIAAVASVLSIVFVLNYMAMAQTACVSSNSYPGTSAYSQASTSGSAGETHPLVGPFYPYPYLNSHIYPSWIEQYLGSSWIEQYLGYYSPQQHPQQHSEPQQQQQQHPITPAPLTTHPITKMPPNIIRGEKWATRFKC